MSKSLSNQFFLVLLLFSLFVTTTADVSNTTKPNSLPVALPSKTKHPGAPECGVLFFVHVAKCAGSSIIVWINRVLHMNIKDEVELYHFDYFSSLSEGKLVNVSLKITDDSIFETYDKNPTVYLSWQNRVKYIDNWVDGMNADKGWLIVHQHAFAPGMKYAFKNYIPKFKRNVESKGCKFILATMLRKPEARMLSHLKYFIIDQDDSTDYIMKYGANWILRYLVYGECDYTFDPPHCVGKGQPLVKFSDVKEGIEIMKHFDIIGTIEEFPAWQKKFAEMINIPFNEMKAPESESIRKRTARNNTEDMVQTVDLFESVGQGAEKKEKKKKLTLGEKEKYMVHRFGVAYDNVFYDAVIKGVDVSGVKKEDLFPEEICYAKNYKSLQNGFCNPGCDYGGLYQHYIEHGKKEGLLFQCLDIDKKDLVCYAQRYPDLYKGFCGGKPEGCKYADLYSHWKDSGQPNALKMGCEGYEELEKQDLGQEMAFKAMKLSDSKDVKNQEQETKDEEPAMKNVAPKDARNQEQETKDQEPSVKNVAPKVLTPSQRLRAKNDLMLKQMDPKTKFVIDYHKQRIIKDEDKLISLEEKIYQLDQQLWELGETSGVTSKREAQTNVQNAFSSGNLDDDKLLEESPGHLLRSLGYATPEKEQEPSEKKPSEVFKGL